MKKTLTNSSIKALLTLLLCFGGYSFAALNGTYTINAGAPASSTNYQSLTSAVSDLTSGTRTDGAPPMALEFPAQ